MITEERKQKITQVLINLEKDLNYEMAINLIESFTEEEVYHIRQIFSQIIRRKTLQGKGANDGLEKTE